MTFPLSAAVLRLAEVPVVPGADDARQWAQDELAKQLYQDAKPGWAEQIGQLLMQALAELLGKVGVAPGQTGLVIVGAVAVLAVVAVVLIVRPRLNRRKLRELAVFAGAASLSANEHRARARAAAAVGDFRAAATEQFRALVRAAEERDISMPAPGRTAVEVATELERAFPGHAVQLHRCAELFNAARYGQETPTVDMYGEIAATDTAVAATMPVYTVPSDAVQAGGGQP